jgi:plastocyanin
MLKPRFSLLVTLGLLVVACAFAQSTSAAANRRSGIARQPVADRSNSSMGKAASAGQQGSDSSKSTTEVSIDNFRFSPATITIPVGTTVTWVNKDDIPHTVVQTDRVFASHVLDTNDKFSYTFTKAGKYEYFCSVHPKMTATVVVK